MERRDAGLSQKKNSSSGVIKVVGTGPGNSSVLTPEAKEAIASSEVIIGYKTYLDQIETLIQDKEVISSSMMQEVKRCEKTFELAENGKTVAIISGGDVGIYAMAGLILEIASIRNSSVPIDVIPGLAALNVCAAKLGAPLMHDFATVSLSDLLTPWEMIEKRLLAAASADFVIVIYNPKSKTRVEQIVKAQGIISQYRKGSTPVGIVTAASRANEDTVISDLDTFLTKEINMQSTVIVGNSTTFCWKEFMITPRGYKDKYAI